MTRRQFAWLILTASICWSCNNRKDNKEDKVELITIIKTDTPFVPPPPPPRPPISDFMTLQDWIFKICDTEKPDKSIIAYNFGIFESETGYTIYLTGSKEYNKDDDDWAVNDDFVPVIREYPLPIEYKKLKWQQVQEKILSSIRATAKTEKFRHSFFAKAKAITTGFDDGDLVRIQVNY